MKAIIGIFVGLLIFLHAPAAHPETIRLATGEWIPFTSASLEHYGEFTERVSTVFQEMGIVPEYRFYPWTRCYDSVLKARLWAAFPYSYTAERAEKVWYSPALSCSKTVFFFYRKKKSGREIRFENIADLKDYRIGGVHGYFYEKLFQTAQLNVDYTNKEISGLEKLMLGRIDLMPLNERVGWHLVRAHFPDEAGHFGTLERPLGIDPLHLIVSRDYPRSRELLERFNAALQRCRETGRVQIPDCR